MKYIEKREVDPVVRLVTIPSIAFVVNGHRGVGSCSLVVGLLQLDHNTCCYRYVQKGEKQHTTHPCRRDHRHDQTPRPITHAKTMELLHRDCAATSSPHTPRAKLFSSLRTEPPQCRPEISYQSRVTPRRSGRSENGSRRSTKTRKQLSSSRVARPARM